MTANSFENVALAQVRMMSGDLYGTYLGAWFDIAELLYRMGETVPSWWEFRPSPMLNQDLVWWQLGAHNEFSSTTQALLWEEGREGLTRPEYVEQLTHAGNVLLRLVHLCKLEGLDY